MNRSPAIILTFTALWLVPVTHAQKQSPADLYTDTLKLERSLRQPGANPSVADFRAAIAAYESLVQQNPSVEYDDRALWQATGLAVEAYHRFREEKDFKLGTRLLDQLAQAYPKSPFVARLPERLSQLDTLSNLGLLQKIEREVLVDIVRVTLQLSREVDFRFERLRQPDRIFFDLPRTEALNAAARTELTFSDDYGTIRSIRLGRHPGQTTRIVLDVKNVDPCSVFTLYDPYRIIVDCNRGDNPVVAVPNPPVITDPSMNPSPVPELSLARQLGLNVVRIVIDPGHGGHDPGAISSRGLQEAAVVLDVAKRLEHRLTAHPGVEVVMTRSTNNYLPLEARAALANRVGADLFLSIHANANENSATRGVETYVLDFARNSSAEQIASRENSVGTRTMSDLGNLLQTIATNSKVHESEHFAEILQRSMVNRLREVDPKLPDLGVKHAPFIVLIGARMPSVLTEISFVTNRHDATLLSTDDYRDLVADALFDGIVRYQLSLNPLPQLAEQN